MASVDKHYHPIGQPSIAIHWHWRDELSGESESLAGVFQHSLYVALRLK